MTGPERLRGRTARWTLATAGALLTLGVTHEARAQAASTPGAISTPHPTLSHASIEWAIAGDDDTDGLVTVRFREQGAAAWRDGLPLTRVPAGSNEGFSWTNRHAGSLFGLAAGAVYEVELTLTDPDGGGDQRLVTVQTRPVPEVPDDAVVIDVTPATIAGALGAAQPGDVLLLGAGTYGDITVGNDGTADRPIVVRGSAVTDVIIDGEVRMDGRSDVWIEELTVRGQIKFNGATRVVVRGCRVEATTATGDGIVSYGEGSTDGYFADNVVVGTTVWAEASLGASGDNLGEGIAMTGPGNVIAYNRVSGFRDCISLLEDAGVRDQFSIDIVGNDLDICADDAIEADFSQGNVRVVGNRMVNSFVALSSQPSLGGPTYFVRNVMFSNIYNPFKLNRGSVGDVALHNTVVKPGDALGVYAGVTWSRALFRNNLFIGGTGGGTYNGFSNGSGRVLQVADADEATCSFDYDGFGSIGTGTFQGRVGGTTFSSLAQMQASTTEVHAVQVDLGVFAESFPFPDTPLTATTTPDLRLAPGSAAVDRGVVLANINDDFAGTAPDLGAYELGDSLPVYGPRDPGAGGGGGAGGAGTAGTGGAGTAGGGAGTSGAVGGAAGAGTAGGGGAGTAGAGAGTSGAAGAGTGGSGTAGSGGTGGVSGTAGSSGTGGSSDGGCGCRLGGSRHGAGWLAAVLMLLPALRRRRVGRS